MKWAAGVQRNGRPRSLDVGCGGGATVSAFNKMGWDGVGIDPSEKAVNAGRELGLDLRTVGIEREELGTFSMVTAFHVLEHTYSPRIFLECCADRLKDEGCLILEVPNYKSWRSQKMGGNWPSLYPNLHLYQFTSETLTRYLGVVKLEIQKIRKVNGWGPLEGYKQGLGKDVIVGNNIKNALFGFRHLVYWFPGARPFVQYILWQSLGFGEFIRVLCRKVNTV